MVSPSDNTRTSSSALASISVKPITPSCNMVGDNVGAAVVGASVGEEVGLTVSSSVGEEVGASVKGESVFSTQTAEILLAGLRSGVIGRTDVLSPEAVQSVLDSTSSILSRVRGSKAGTTRVEKELSEAISNLDENESALLEDIVNEITQRSIARALDRLSTVERVI